MVSTWSSPSISWCIHLVSFFFLFWPHASYPARSHVTQEYSILCSYKNSLVSLVTVSLNQTMARSQIERNSTIFLNQFPEINMEFVQGLFNMRVGGTSSDILNPDRVYKNVKLIQRLRHLTCNSWSQHPVWEPSVMIPEPRVRSWARSDVAPKQKTKQEKKQTPT